MGIGDWTIIVIRVGYSYWTLSELVNHSVRWGSVSGIIPWTDVLPDHYHMVENKKLRSNLTMDGVPDGNIQAYCKPL